MPNRPMAQLSIRSPDLVLLDWMMPGTSGLELLRRLRRDELTTKLPIIMLTAKAEEDSKISGLDAGADDYIPKPFSPRELISRVKALLRRIGRDELAEPIAVGELLFDPDRTLGELLQGSLLPWAQQSIVCCSSFLPTKTACTPATRSSTMSGVAMST